MKLDAKKIRHVENDRKLAEVCSLFAVIVNVNILNSLIKRQRLA